jgi:hypothetical protein
LLPTELVVRDSTARAVPASAAAKRRPSGRKHP